MNIFEFFYYLNKFMGNGYDNNHHVTVYNRLKCSVSTKERC